MSIVYPPASFSRAPLVTQTVRICPQCRRLWFNPFVRKIPWRRKWLLTTVFLPGESHRQTLVGYSPWHHKEFDTTKWLILEKKMATHSSILAWRIPWTEEPGGLQSMGSQRVRHDWGTSLHFRQLTHIHTHILFLFNL